MYLHCRKFGFECRHSLTQIVGVLFIAAGIRPDERDRPRQPERNYANPALRVDRVYLWMPTSFGDIARDRPDYDDQEDD